MTVSCAFFRGSPKLVEYILWEPWLSVINAVGIYLMVAELFWFGPKWWTYRPTHCHCHTRSLSIFSRCYEPLQIWIKVHICGILVLFNSPSIVCNRFIPFMGLQDFFAGASPSCLWAKAGCTLDKPPAHRWQRLPCKVPTAHQEQFGVQYLAQGHVNMQLSSTQGSWDFEPATFLSLAELLYLHIFVAGLYEKQILTELQIQQI